MNFLNDYGSSDDDDDDDDDVLECDVSGLKRSINNRNEIDGPPGKKYCSKREECGPEPDAWGGITDATDADSRKKEEREQYPLPPEISKLTNKISKCHIPDRKECEYIDHVKGVQRIAWCLPYGQVLASASLDHNVHIYDPFLRKQRVCVLSGHDGAVRDLSWSCDGSCLVTGGFDGKALLFDVCGERLTQECIHEGEMVSCVATCPHSPYLFLSGTNKSKIRLWDSRSGSCERIYSGVLGQVLDLEFSPNGEEFFVSCDVAMKNALDKTIMAFNFEKGAVVSNQIYVETFTCPCLRMHPDGRHFVAQTNGGYAAIFSSKRPYRMNKLKRFESHRVSGFSVHLSFSRDGSVLATGSANGNIHYYDWNSGRTIRVIHAHSKACMDTEFHPVLPSVVASCSWDNRICIFS